MPTERAKAACGDRPFTVYQDAYYPTETALRSRPATGCSGAKTGTMTNSERVVTLCPVSPPAGRGEADWRIFAVGRRLGFTEQLNFANAAEVYAGLFN